MEQQRWIDTITNAHPVDAELFGMMGAAAAHLCEDLSKCFVDKRFEFMDHGEFQALERPSEIGRIYWAEMLFRVYWAAALNIMRHQRWQAGCIHAFSPSPNLPVFAASLRGLLEASQDAWYSLRQVPSLLAENQQAINAALSGRSDHKFGVSEELENRLIHFIYGRKVEKDKREMMPDSHVAREPKEYRNAIGLPENEREAFKDLYDELCGICHPTAFSLTFLWEEEATGIRIKDGQDYLYIRDICHKYKQTISIALSLSVTLSALCLKALNWFSLPEVKCAAIECWDFDAIPAWRKISQTALDAGPDPTDS